ncbi:MAG: hypothetical protein HDS56_06440 [Barnesiella sp.]|nr:hypothetical protein [Barnesiella sp.]
MEDRLQQFKDKLNLKGISKYGNYADFFKSIADDLLNHVFIAKDDKFYEIIDIEFYLFSHAHPDVITYPRQIDGGQWYFHQSGVDLSFASDDTVFGGILIRGICEHKDGATPIIGPLKCVDKLWDQFDAFNPSPVSYPRIVMSDISLGKQIISSKRWIKVTKSQTHEGKIKNWIERLPKSINRADLPPISELVNNVFNEPIRFQAKTLDEVS